MSISLMQSIFQFSQSDVNTVEEGCVSTDTTSSFMPSRLVD